MMDDPTPVEQAHAARWAAEWLNDAGWKSQFAAASAAVDALKRHADEMAPPETVESLRAERDEVWRTRLRMAEKLSQAYDDLEEANATIARLRATHTEAEAAWARSKPGASDTADLRMGRHPSHWPGPEHWLGGDHSNQAPREQDGKTPGQTLWEARFASLAWSILTPEMKDRQERVAAAVLAAHGTPTLTDEDRAEAYCRGWSTCARSMPDLAPVGEHPEPGTRGLLPVVLDDAHEWNYDETFSYLCDAESELGRTILADPRPGGPL